MQRVLQETAESHLLTKDLKHSHKINTPHVSNALNTARASQQRHEKIFYSKVPGHKPLDGNELARCTRMQGALQITRKHAQQVTHTSPT
jgi:ribonuclease HI